METSNKTGLGNSLLLQRTVISAVPPATPAVVPAQEATPAPVLPYQPESIPEPIPIPPIQASRKSPKQPLVLRDQCTLYIERGVNRQLHIVAHAEGRERSEIVSDILRKHLPKYRIELEGQGSE